MTPVWLRVTEPMGASEVVVGDGRKKGPVRRSTRGPVPTNGTTPAFLSSKGRGAEGVQKVADLSRDPLSTTLTGAPTESTQENLGSTGWSIRPRVTTRVILQGVPQEGREISRGSTRQEVPGTRGCPQTCHLRSRGGGVGAGEFVRVGVLPSSL